MRKEEYGEEARWTIEIIEKIYKIDWNNKQELFKVTRLDLFNKDITDISCMKELTHLAILDLENNQITDISSLKELKNLTLLNLRDNKLINISSLKKLTNLTRLDLRNNKITDISSLKKLSDLTYLNLRSNKIIDIPTLKELKNLNYLYLDNNQITDISTLKELKNLNYLYLNNNKITDISILKELKNLTNLYLRDNQIKKFPKELLEFNLGTTLKNDYIRRIILKNNPIEEPPLEIMTQGKEAIQKYFESLKEEQKELNELKILFIGDGGAGKTSLIKKIFGEDFDSNENMTHGINIRSQNIEVESTPIKANFWDFGGQEMMHSTHQFFLSRRSLYVVVLDGRKEEDSEYWLNFIKSFGGDSPVIVVLNKIDDNEGFEVNRKFLQEKYPNIVGFYKTSCMEDRGIESFYNALQKQMLKVEMIKSIWGKSWFDVKEHIEKLEENYIKQDQFLNICNRFQVADSAIEVLTNYLDDLGIAIYFDDFELDDIHTLNPQWITNGVYKIVTSKELSLNKGLLDTHQLKTLLASKQYPRDTHRYITELMKKFELCFAIDKRSILVPSALEVEEKAFEFDYNDALRFELEYSFLPPSVISTFIVKSHEDIKDHLRWRSGVVLEDHSTKTEAVIKVDSREKRVYIYVSGEQKRDFFAVIRKRFDEINSKFKEIEINELIPLPNFPKHKVKYKELIGYEKAGLDEYFNGELGEFFSVSKLLNGIERPESREGNTYNFNGKTNFKEDKSMHQTHSGNGDNVAGSKTVNNNGIKINGNNTGVANSGNNNTIAQNITTNDNNLKELLQHFQAEANKVAEVLNEDEKDDFIQDVQIITNDTQKGKKSKHFDMSKKGLLEIADENKGVSAKFKEYIPRLLQFIK